MDELVFVVRLEAAGEVTPAGEQPEVDEAPDQEELTDG